MSATLPKRSKRRAHPRQEEREARKLANRQEFAPGEAELSFVSADGAKYYRLNPVHIPGYTYAF